MPALLKWLRETSVKLVDPDREGRVLELTTKLERRLFDERSDFDLQRAIDDLGIDVRDFDTVRGRVFSKSLQRAWKDQVLTEKEREALTWVALKLELPPDTEKSLRAEAAERVVETFLAKAFSDGRLDDNEAQQLTRLAESLNTTTRAVIRAYAQKEGEAFLTGIFALACRNGTLPRAEWAQVVKASETLGLSIHELTALVHTHAERLLEHALADAKSDGRVTDSELANLRWIMTTFEIPLAYQEYVEKTVAEVQLLESIASGHLPTVASTNATLRAGEVVHYHGPAVFLEQRQRSAGPVFIEHDGDAAITDYRLILTAATKAFDVPHRRVLQIQCDRGSIQLQTSGKGSGQYDFRDRPKLANAIYFAAIRRANQTLVASIEGLPTRHISREVRQRVWQTFGGRCAECKSDQYLEFDHVIPVAKGGSNSESNVQLLCRKCNLKKADFI